MSYQARVRDRRKCTKGVRTLFRCVFQKLVCAYCEPLECARVREALDEKFVRDVVEHALEERHVGWMYRETKGNKLPGKVVYLPAVESERATSTGQRRRRTNPTRDGTERK